MIHFDSIWKRAVIRCGDEDALRHLLSDLSTQKILATRRDSEVLGTMTRCIFEAGFSPDTVRRRWPGFLAAFYEFEPSILTSLNDEEWQRFQFDTRIIRNAQKINAIRHNATMMTRLAMQHESFGQFLDTWPSGALVELFQLLAKEGQRLGPRTVQAFFFRIGKDCFGLSEEVFKALANEGLELPGRIQSQRTLRAIESVFTEWQSQSGLALNHISEVLALSVESLGAPTVSETQPHYMPSFPMGKAWTTSPALSGRKT